MRQNWGRQRKSRPRITATSTIAAVLALGFLLSWVLGPTGMWVRQLAISSDGWTVVSILGYPLVQAVGGLSLFWFALSIAFFIWIGHSVESVKGWQTTALVFLAGTVLHGLAAVGASYIGQGIVASHYLPEVFMLVYLAGLNPVKTILFWSVPIQIRWLALFMTAVSAVMFGVASPPFGIVCVLPVAVAWFWGNGLFERRGQRPTASKSNEFDQFMTTVRSKEKKREEDERLRKLFESSVADPDTKD